MTFLFQRTFSLEKSKNYVETNEGRILVRDLFDSCFISEGLYQFYQTDTLESTGQGDDGLNMPWKQSRWER